VTPSPRQAIKASAEARDMAASGQSANQMRIVIGTEYSTENVNSDRAGAALIGPSRSGSFWRLGRVVQAWL
jgi:hypothetical protein